MHIHSRSWSLHHIVGGAASVRLFGPQLDYRQLQQQVATRAVAEDVTAEVALKRTMQERVLGQALMTLICLGCVLLACLGAVRGWSNMVVVPLALLPVVAQLLVAKMNQHAALKSHYE